MSDKKKWDRLNPKVLEFKHDVSESNIDRMMNRLLEDFGGEGGGITTLAIVATYNDNTVGWGCRGDGDDPAYIDLLGAVEELKFRLLLHKHAQENAE